MTTQLIPSFGRSLDVISTKITLQEWLLRVGPTLPAGVSSAKKKKKNLEEYRLRWGGELEGSEAHLTQKNCRG